MTKRDELIALDPAGLEAAVRECARITAPEISDVEYERIKADNSPRYQNTRAEMERTLRAYLNAARSQPNVQPALEAPADGDGEPAFPTWDAEDEAYELGKRDGYESAIQDLDIATGGDGEFKGSTIPGGTVDVPAMKARIVGRTTTAPPSEHSSTRSEVTALADIAAERERQREVEGWSSVHDDGHDTGEMAGAAACYALSTIKHWAKNQVIKLIWPWSDEWWKPKDARRNLVKAGALIVAEIERLDRLEGPRP